MWRGVIFDLDGTLVDSLPGITASLNRALAACGFPDHGQAAVRGCVGCGARELARRALPAGLDQADDVAARVEAAFRDDYGRTWRDGTRAYPGIPEELAALTDQGARLAVLSNKPHPFTVAMVADLLPGIAFAAVLGQRDGVPRKPDPAAAHEACRAMDCRNGEVVLAGDSTVDMETARNAGLAAAAVTWGYHDRAALAAFRPDLWLDRVGELRGLAGR